MKDVSTWLTYQEKEKKGAHLNAKFILVFVGTIEDMPTSNWNRGKQSEFKDRKPYEMVNAEKIPKKYAI